MTKLSGQYKRCWKIWQNFCHTHEIGVLEAQEDHLLAYLAFVAENFSDGVSTAYTHLSAVGYYYRINGLPSLTESTSVHMYMKGLKRRHINTPVNRALAMSKEILSAMRNLLKSGAANLVLWRTVWRAHVEFALMLRFDDVKRLTRSELTFEENATGKFIRLKLIGKIWCNML